MFKVGFLYPGYENLGIEYLSAGLKTAGCRTKLFLDPIIFDESGFIGNRPLAKAFSFQKSILEQIVRFRPDMVCFSVITDNYQWASQWARAIKERLSVPIVFGGIHPTSVPERVIAEPFVDYVCLGEGDEALVELAGALRNGTRPVAVRNIWGKEEGRLFKNPVRPPLANLDLLPFPDKGLFYDSAPIFNSGYLVATSRGCPFSCSYCCNNVFHALYEGRGSVIRRRSVQNILEELRAAKSKYHPRFVHFVDDVFNFDRPWLSAFLDQYRDAVALPFSCYLYPDLVDDDIAEHMKKSGCFKVQMGLQIMDEGKRSSVLGRVSRQENIARAIDILKKHRIYTVCDSIFGFPDETEDELLSLCRFYDEHTPDHCENFWLRYYPKTDITAWALRNGFLDASRVDKIEAGKFYFGLIKSSEHPGARTYAGKIMFFLSLYPFLRKNFRRFIIKRRIYRRLPSLNPLFYLVAIRLAHHPPFDFNTIRTMHRYGFFMSKKSADFFRGMLRCLTGPMKKIVNKLLFFSFTLRLLRLRSACRLVRSGFKRLLGRPIPEVAILALTFRCPCRCGHCSAGLFKADESELNVDEWKRVVDELDALGTVRVHISGGEPMLKQGYEEIIKYAADKGMVVFLETNGFNLDMATIKRLKGYGLASIDVSLDDVRAEIHDRWRNRQGAHEEALKALRLCREAGMAHMVSTFATRDSIGDGRLERLIHFSKKMKAGAIRILPPQPSGRWLDKEGLRLTADERRSLEDAFPFYTIIDRTGLPRCPIKKRYSVYIAAGGQIHPCPHMPFSFGNIRSTTIADALESMARHPMFDKRSLCFMNDPEFRRTYVKPLLEKDTVWPVTVPSS